MITRAEFWRIIDTYGTQIRPAQTIFYGITILLVAWLFFRPGRAQDLLTKLYLAIVFAWNGVMFYGLLARGMAGDGYANYIFAVLFLVVAALFVVDLFRQRMQFVLPVVRWRRIATPVGVLLVLCYPVLGSVEGHPVTSLMMPGTFPCPTVALGLLLLTTALPRVDKFIYIALLVCAIPFTLFVQIARYGVYEDIILLAIGLYSLVVLVMDWKAARA